MKELEKPGLDYQSNALGIPATCTFDEWQEIGGQLQKIEKAVPWWIGDWLNYGERSYGEKYAQALDATKQSYGALRNAKWVASEYEKSRRRDNLSFAHHQDALGADDPDAVLDWAEENSATRQDLRAYIRDQRRQIKQETLPPVGEYSVIYADPPWQYEFSLSDSRQIENQYPTMPVGEICELQPPAANDCVLFMWATSPKLIEALEVISAWGFEYKTNAVWDKQKIGMGYYFRQQHELLLVATKGSPAMSDPSDRVSSVVSVMRGEHSEKPEVFYEVIESLYTHQPKIELFSRTPREGWAAWGNQVA